MQINVVNRHMLDSLLERKRDDGFRPENIDLSEMLQNILAQANRFVPSESGSILLDAAKIGRNRRKTDVLFFVAAFGKDSDKVIGRTLPICVGIAGNTYFTGRPYISRSVKTDSLFYRGIDKKTKYQTKSIVCAPIRFRTGVIGVIELLNKRKSVNYTANDLTLLKIFAEYTSTLIQNSLDAKRFGELSIKDNLTGLFNDRYVFDRLTKEAGRALHKKTDLSLIFFDLDRFKEINDNHGHLAGSKVLTEVAEITTDTLKKTDAVPARYGGDEFIIIMPDADIKKAAAYAEKLRVNLEKNVFLKKPIKGVEKALKIKGVISGSFGVASLKANMPKRGNERDIRNSLIRLADEAMYRSKEDGKNRVTIAGKD